MQRPLKFRHWDTVMNAMRPFTDRTDIEVLKDGTVRSYWPKNILLQWTGLNDKNGKEIYEGDVVQLHCGGFDRMRITATIEWDEYKWRAHIHDKSLTVIGGTSDGKVCSMGEIHSWSGMHSCFSFERYIEVIGNIYENKDLLK